MFHNHCVKDKISRGYPGTRITFGYLDCPLCKKQMKHASLQQHLKEPLALQTDLLKKSLIRLKIDGLDKDKKITSPDSRFFNDTQGFAMVRGISHRWASSFSATMQPVFFFLSNFLFFFIILTTLLVNHPLSPHRSFSPVQASYAYYMCFKCKKPYFGGRRDCEQNAEADNRPPAEFICFDCSDLKHATCDNKSHKEYQ